MEQTQFSRAGKRRFNKRVNSLVSLQKENGKLFWREWHKQVQGWLNEVHRRAKDWREGAEFRNSESVDGSIVRGRAEIFGVLEIAEKMLAACGADVDRMVGDETRRVLTNECVKAVASICDGRLNYMVDHHLYRQARY
jgi:hypothetical protein